MRPLPLVPVQTMYPSRFLFLFFLVLDEIGRVPPKTLDGYILWGITLPVGMPTSNVFFLRALSPSALVPSVT
jgi:hypothetical protein